MLKTAKVLEFLLENGLKQISVAHFQKLCIENVKKLHPIYYPSPHPPLKT